MADKTEGHTTIAASAADVMAVITDFESYPEWNEVKSTKVLKKDSQGRGTEVAFEVHAPMIGELTYTLAYSYAANDGGVSWTTKEIQGKVKDIQGEYALDELDEDETKVTYRVAIDLAISLPGFLKKQADKQIIKNGLDNLKKRVEQG
ncbi:MAG: SRPBCC family protein [Actinomycetota bacterium]|nr:SRPBCC family protein [Actinomycetota bacterium]